MKPRILISKCIEHGMCRYDGSTIKSNFVKLLKDYVTFVCICPEMAIGLPAPREALRLVKEDRLRLKTSLSGQDYTESMTTFSNRYLSELSDIQGVVLKSKSPSCGFKEVKVYPAIGKVPCLDQKTSGLFGGLLLEKYPELAIEDEGRLRNYAIRHHFLTRIFVAKEFDSIKKMTKINDLIQFQSRHKYLLMAYNQQLQKKMGHLIATNDKLESTLQAYETLLYQALSQPVSQGRNINMMMHIFGYYSKQLSNEEKDYFFRQLKLYKTHKLPVQAIMQVLYVWVIRFNMDYLKKQSIFQPYPNDILDLLDSGKGVK
jgi:uncharacterized protein YbbK (DUF523 family)/uncharacterized protein YbgA (DUF1722 family)